MKKIYFFLLFVGFTLTSWAQNGTYINYTQAIEAGEGNEMMVAMLDGSSMEIASDKATSYTKVVFGMMYTIEFESDLSSGMATIVMTGMMGDMAFQGDADSLNSAQPAAAEIELVKGKKKILGYKCKKATATDAAGNVSTYWYTTKLKQIETMGQAPVKLPGMSLEMVVVTEGMTITYTATEVKTAINMDDYKVIVPEGVEVLPISEMANIGGGM